MTDATTFEIIPAIDLRAGRVVRLRQGDFARETVYSDDPGRSRERFADAGARWLHVVDLDGARGGEPVNGAAVRADRRGGGGPDAGGGRRRPSDRRGRGVGPRERRSAGRRSARRRSRIRRSPPSSSAATGRIGSPSPSTSATARRSVTAGRREAPASMPRTRSHAGARRSGALARSRRRGRRDLRSHRHRPRRPARRAGPGALRAAHRPRHGLDHRLGRHRHHRRPARPPRARLSRRDRGPGAPGRFDGSRARRWPPSRPDGQWPPWPPAASSSLRWISMTFSAMWPGTSS